VPYVKLEEAEMTFSRAGVLPANVTIQGTDGKVDLGQTKAVAECVRDERQVCSGQQHVG